MTEDDTRTASEITAELAERGDGSTAFVEALADKADILIGCCQGSTVLTVIVILRKEGVRTPVFVLRALGGVDERVRGLRMGGDDYLSKPFALVELMTRVEALLGRPAASWLMMYAIASLTGMARAARTPTVTARRDALSEGKDHYG